MLLPTFRSFAGFLRVVVNYPVPSTQSQPPSGVSHLGNSKPGTADGVGCGETKRPRSVLRTQARAEDGRFAYPPDPPGALDVQFDGSPSPARQPSNSLPPPRPTMAEPDHPYSIGVCLPPPPPFPLTQPLFAATARPSPAAWQGSGLETNWQQKLIGSQGRESVGRKQNKSDRLPESKLSASISVSS